VLSRQLQKIFFEIFLFHSQAGRRRTRLNQEHGDIIRSLNGA